MGTLYAANRSDSVLLVLRPGKRVQMIGTGRMEIVFGEVEVLGWVRKGAAAEDRVPVSFSAPKTSVPFVLSCPLKGTSTDESEQLENPDKLSRLRWRLMQICPGESVAGVLDDWMAKSAAILLQREKLRASILATEIIPRLFQPDGGISYKEVVEGLNVLTLEPPPLYPTQISQGIKHYLKACFQADGKTIIAVVGSQNTGKSTFVNFIINTALSTGYGSVCHLETDVGQSEFTPAGCLALTACSRPLLCPPFAHRVKPIKAFYLGDDQLGARAEAFSSSISMLIREFESLSDTQLLLVNTPGWTTGLGVDFIGSILSGCQPNQVFYLQSRNAANDEIAESDRFRQMLEETVSDGAIKDLSLFDSNLPLLTSNYPLKSFQMRDLSLTSHLCGSLPENQISSILEAVPWEVPWSIFSLWFYADIPPTRVFAALNTTVVALCTAPEDKLGEHIDGNRDYPRMIDHNDESYQLEFHGYAIVRAIDMAQRKFFILANLDPKTLENVNVMAKGTFDLPTHFHFSQTTPEPAPYVIYPEGFSTEIAYNMPLKRKRMGRDPLQTKSRPRSAYSWAAAGSKYAKTKALKVMQGAREKFRKSSKFQKVKGSVKHKIGKKRSSGVVPEKLWQKKGKKRSDGKTKGAQVITID